VILLLFDLWLSSEFPDQDVGVEKMYDANRVSMMKINQLTKINIFLLRMNLNP
jgi:hypothetical protein